MTDNTYNVIKPDNGVPVKAWTKGVPLEDAARQQLLNVAQLPFIYKWVAAMPDVHWGIGATVGSVIPTRGCLASWPQMLKTPMFEPQSTRVGLQEADGKQYLTENIHYYLDAACIEGL
jgi:hypothetical protein